MPIYRNNGGSPQEHRVYVNQGGVPVECNVYENQGGTPVLLHTPKRHIDSFEDGNLSEYNTGGSSSYFQPEVVLDAAGALDGDYYVRLQDTTGNAGGGSGWAWVPQVGGDGIDVPEAGQTFRVGVWVATADEIAEVAYGLQQTGPNRASPQGYKLLLKSDFMAIRYTRSDNTSYTMASTTVSQASIAGSWVYFEGVWPPNPSNKHTFRILTTDGSGKVTGTFKSISGDGYPDDADYSDGGFGYRGGDDSTGAYEVRFDDAHFVE